MISTLETGQNGMFLHERVGRNGKLFKMFKVRTLKGNYTNSVTTEQTHKFTYFGRLFMKLKLDELPQLFNILLGQMSFVGPRPDVVGYADELKGEDRIILSVKPGITGPAQIKYKNENELLQKADNPKRFNDEVLWPDKVKINKDYVEHWSFAKDIAYLFKTVF